MPLGSPLSKRPQYCAWTALWRLQEHFTATGHVDPMLVHVKEITD